MCCGSFLPYTLFDLLMVARHIFRRRASFIEPKLLHCSPATVNLSRKLQRKIKITVSMKQPQRWILIQLRTSVFAMTPLASASRAAAGMRRAGTLIRSPLEARNKDKDKSSGDMYAPEVSSSCKYSYPIQTCSLSRCLVSYWMR
jgi:hypothetical protein